MFDPSPALRPSASLPALKLYHLPLLPSSTRLSNLPQSYPMARPPPLSDIDNWPYHALQAEAAKHSIRRNLGAAKLRQAIKQTLANNGSTADLPREWLILNSSAPGPSSRPLPPPKPAARLKRSNSRIAAPEPPQPIRPTVPPPLPPPANLKLSVQEEKSAEPAAQTSDHFKRPIRPKPISSTKDSKLPRKPLHARQKQDSGPSITVRKKALPPKASRRPIEPESMDVDSITPNPDAHPQPSKSPEASQELAQALRREAESLGLGDQISSASLAELVRLTQRIIQSLGSGTSLLDAIRSALPTNTPPDPQSSRLSAPSMHWAIPNVGSNNMLSIHSGNSRDSLGPRIGLGRYVSTPARSGEFEPPMINTPNLPAIPMAPTTEPPKHGADSDDDETTQSEIESMLIRGISAPPGSARRKLAQMQASDDPAAETDGLGPLRKKTKLTKPPVVDEATGLTPIDEVRESGSSVPSHSRQTSSGPDAPTAGPSSRRTNGAPDAPALDLQKLSLFPVRKTTGSRLLEKPKPPTPSASPVSKPTLFGTENLYGDTTAQPFGEMFDRVGRYGGFPGNGPSGSSPSTGRRHGKK